MKRIPPFRKLRGYAFDPSLSLRLDTFGINEMVYRVPWEDFAEIRRRMQDAPPPGTALVGEYLEILDYDPTVKQFYEAVDLDEPYILAQDGLKPSEGNPQFHQQMVYAVAMTTIQNFEKALGRRILWAPKRYSVAAQFDRKDPKPMEEYLPRLRIYPHAMREANAYYSPIKRALLFGYFESMPADASLGMRGSTVFTCLSHDIIAHEITHAILDGIYPYFNEATNPDVLAFHEAFADIVALFQHFSFPEVLQQQIAKTRGDLRDENLLGQLAQEFGTAIGSHGSLRDFIGKPDKSGNWKPVKPKADDYKTIHEPHERGALLVAAVFEAFNNIYRSRIADLMRLATNGTGVLPAGELHPDLVNRLSIEASKTAGHILNMCIRALDYCPPVDITFGEYLRAIITADIDIMQNDSRNYRIAFIEAFRRRGIYPQDVKSISEDSLRFRGGPELNLDKDEETQFNKTITQFLERFSTDVSKADSREKIYRIQQGYIARKGGKKGLHHRLQDWLGNANSFEKATGMVMREQCEELGIDRSKSYGKKEGPVMQVTNLRRVTRVNPEGKLINCVVFSLLQRTVVNLHTGKATAPKKVKEMQEGDLHFRGGCTIILDLDTKSIKHIIPKRLIVLNNEGDARIDMNRARAQYAYQVEEGPNGFSEYQRYFMDSITEATMEPFHFVHSH